MAGKAQAERTAIPPEHTGNVKVTRPQTGAEYLDSLRDDRAVYIYGERVKDVTTHPAFRNTARMVARLYDALHDDKRKAQAPAADRHRQWRHDARLLQGAEDDGRSDRRPRRDRRMGQDHLWLDGPRAGLQGRVPRDAWARIPTSTIRTRTTPSAGTSSARSACRSSITRSSIRRSIATVRRTRSPTSAAMSRRKPTQASSCRAPRWSRPDRC